MIFDFILILKELRLAPSFFFVNFRFLNITIVENKISVKQILVDILSIMPQVEKEFKNKERYSKLVGFLSSKDYYVDEDLAYPTLKEIEAITGLKTYHIRKQLLEIYKRLLDYEYTFDFNEVEIFVHIQYFKNFATVKCKNLTHIPKIGENITLPFLRAKVGTDYFFVEDIRHQFEENKQIITLFLIGGIFNSYWYYRKHKAFELGEIGIGEKYDLDEFDMKSRLGLRW